MRPTCSFVRVLGFVFSALLCPSEGLAQGFSADAENSPFQLSYEKYVLGNGLEVILHRDPRLPMVAVNLWYHVGAAHEAPGESGLAHLFEHLMFEGSEHVGDRFDPLLESVGGTNMNGTTSWDRTNYFETVPSEHLELALWLEADRMGYAVLTQERLDVQREVVKNERRESYDNAPYGMSWLRLYEEMFVLGHPYRGAVIGSMEDLSRTDLQKARSFFEQMYAPGNATLCLAGNFDSVRARQLIEKHFGSLKRRGGRVASPSAVPTSVPFGTRSVVEEPVALAQVLYGWLGPAPYTDDKAALDAALSVLVGGKTSRLYQALVQTGLANWVDGDVDDADLATIVTLELRVASGHTVDELEGVVERELLALAKDGPTDEELSRAFIAFDLGLRSDLQLLNSGGGETGRAGTLQRLNHYLGDPGGLPQWVERRKQVNAEAVRRVITNFLTKERRRTVTTLPQEEADAH